MIQTYKYLLICNVLTCDPTEALYLPRRRLGPAQEYKKVIHNIHLVPDTEDHSNPVNQALGG